MVYVIYMKRLKRLKIVHMTANCLVVVTLFALKVKQILIALMIALMIFVVMVFMII